MNTDFDPVALMRVRDAALQMANESPHGMWGDYGEPMIPAGVAVHLLSQLWPSIGPSTIPARMVVDFLNALIDESLGVSRG